MHRDLVVMGASSGGIEALRAIAAALPNDFEAAICAVVHMSPDSPGILDQMIRRVSRLRVRAVASREPLRPGCFYVPTPDRHMIVEPSLVCAARAEGNRFRPAVDPLFRSAAQTYGPRVIGVILTGDLDDGTAGLWAIKQLGGTAIVQDPPDALVPSMPESARKHVRIDHSVALADLPALLARLVAEDLSEAGGYTVAEPIDIEVNIARHDAPLQAGIEKLGIPSIYACPECHGVLLQLRESERLRFRCHTGHAYSVESLLADMDQGIEDSLGGSVRGLQEKLLLARHLAHRAREASDEATAAKWHQLSEGAERRAGWVRQALIEAQRLQRVQRLRRRTGPFPPTPDAVLCRGFPWDKDRQVLVLPDVRKCHTRSVPAP